MKNIYLDNAATTPVDPDVFRAMEPYFRIRPARHASQLAGVAGWGNAGSLHYFGQKAMKALDESREKIATAIGADFREIIFTGSATEANNLALRGVVRAAWLSSDGTGRSSAPAAEAALDLSPRRLRQGGDQARWGSETFRTKTAKPPYRIIISKIEHESILETAKDLEREGVEVVYLPVDKNGLVNLKKLKESLNERTILVSVMYANNEIGTMQPIKEIAKIIKAFRVERLAFSQKNKALNPNRYSLYPLLHTDAVQAFQFLDCNINELGVDLMTLSAHKIYGPKGVGVLYQRLAFRGERLGKNLKSLNPKPYPLCPMITGGGQEFGLRSGTENIPLIVGFAKAVELVVKNREKEAKRISALRDRLWNGLKKINSKIKLNGSEKNRLPNILNVCFPGKNAGDLLVKLDLAGVAVSAGSACSARSLEPSYVLKACGLPLNVIKSSLRISLGKFTTKKDINEALKRIKSVMAPSSNG